MEASTSLASVAGNGAILLGRNIVADAHARRLVRVVSHAHSDHTKGLASSIRESLFIVATPTTMEMLGVLGYKLPREKSVALEYGRRITIDSEDLVLVRSRHIAGSAQVVVESSEYRVGYTGDFKMPGTKPIEDLDVLVLDATYGSPRLQRRWGDWDAVAALTEIIDRFIDQGPIWVYGYNGKLQEVMAQLRLRGVEYTFKADPVTLRLAEIASRFYKVNLDPVEAYQGGVVDESAILFIHTSKMRSKRSMPGVHVILTGWELRAPAVIVDDRTFRVSLSDHATFKEIIRYVEQARPRRVVVDAYRGTDAWFTAKYIERMLGIKAEPQPPATLK